MNTVTVGQVMEPVDAHIAQSAILAGSRRPSHAGAARAAARVGLRGRYRGVITARAVTDALADGDHDDATVATIVEMPAAVNVTDRLEQTLNALETAYSAIAVLDADHSNVVGWLTHQQVLLALHPARPTPLPTPAQPRDEPGTAAAATGDRPGPASSPPTRSTPG